MNLLHLEYFRELAHSEHVQETAKKLHVSASAISSGVKNLEQELGVCLFDRIGRNMRLNEYGKRFLPYVEEAFHALQQGVEDLDAARLQHKNKVSFSVRDAAFWIGVFGRFNELHPDIYIRQIDSDPDPRGRLMDLADLDFMITDIDVQNERLDHCALHADTLVLAIPRDHPLAKENDKPRSIFDFQQDTFFFRPKEDYFQQLVDARLTQIGFRPQKVMEMEYILRSMMLEKNAGVIITTELTTQNELYRHAVVVRILEFIGFPHVKKLYWRRDKPLSPAALQFKDYVIAATAEGSGFIRTEQRQP